EKAHRVPQCASHVEITGEDRHHKNEVERAGRPFRSSVQCGDDRASLPEVAPHREDKRTLRQSRRDSVGVAVLARDLCALCQIFDGFPITALIGGEDAEVRIVGIVFTRRGDLEKTFDLLPCSLPVAGVQKSTYVLAYGENLLWKAIHRFLRLRNRLRISSGTEIRSDQGRQTLHRYAF